MSCPYFRESHFGMCTAVDSIHIPSIDEMERFCFRPWFDRCPHMTRFWDMAWSQNMQSSGAADVSRSGDESPLRTS